VVSLLLPAWRHGELGHGEALALPPVPVQTLHPDPEPQPLDLVQNGPETLLQLRVGLGEADQPSLAPLLHHRCKITKENCGEMRRFSVVLV